MRDRTSPLETTDILGVTEHGREDPPAQPPDAGAAIGRETAGHEEDVIAAAILEARARDAGVLAGVPRRGTP